MKTLRESRCIDLLCFYTSALEGGEGSASRPGRFLPPGKTRYPLYRRLGGPQERPGTHCTGGWVGPRKDPVPIVQEVGWAPGKTRYPLYRRLGGPQGRSGRVRKNSPPPGYIFFIYIIYSLPFSFA